MCRHTTGGLLARAAESVIMQLTDGEGSYSIIAEQ